MKKAFAYVGPPYDKGLMVDGISNPLRPAEFSDADREAFLDRYPEFSEWWAETPPSLPVEAVPEKAQKPDRKLAHPIAV